MVGEQELKLARFVGVQSLRGFLGTGGCGPEGCGGQLASLSFDGCGSSGAYDFFRGLQKHVVLRVVGREGYCNCGSCRGNRKCESCCVFECYNV